MADDRQDIDVVTGTPTTGLWRSTSSAGIAYGRLRAPSTEVPSTPSWISPSNGVPATIDWPTIRCCQPTISPASSSPARSRWR